MAAIEVRVNGRGVAAGDDLQVDVSVRAACDLCSKELDAVVGIGPASGPAVFGCAECIRERLGAISVAKWRLQDGHKTPWGKVSG